MELNLRVNFADVSWEMQDGRDSLPNGDFDHVQATSFMAISQKDISVGGKYARFSNCEGVYVGTITGGSFAKSLPLQYG